MRSLGYDFSFVKFERLQKFEFGKSLFEDSESYTAFSKRMIVKQLVVHIVYLYNSAIVTVHSSPRHSLIMALNVT